MIRDFVKESFIPLYGKFQTDFVIAISNVSNTKVTVDLVNEYFIPVCGKCQTDFMIEISNILNTKNVCRFLYWIFQHL